MDGPNCQKNLTFQFVFLISMNISEENKSGQKSSDEKYKCHKQVLYCFEFLLFVVALSPLLS